MAPVLKSTMRRMKMNTTTQMSTIIFTFFHQNLRATFCDVVLKCSDCQGQGKVRGLGLPTGHKPRQPAERQKLPSLPTLTDALMTGWRPGSSLGSWAPGTLHLNVSGARSPLALLHVTLAAVCPWEGRPWG